LNTKFCFADAHKRSVRRAFARSLLRKALQRVCALSVAHFTQNVPEAVRRLTNAILAAQERLEAVTGT
jgi:Mg-chelatase subunit ChlD